MERIYTEEIRNGWYDLAEHDTAEIWADLDRSAEALRSGNWKAHFRSVVENYTVSSRFAMMRILFELTTDLPLSKTDMQALKNGFTVDGLGTFPDITPQHAAAMDEDELGRYKALLMQRVKDYAPEHCKEADKLIDGMLAIAPAGWKCRLGRENILRLGHMLRLSLEHMQFILLRVLADNEVLFRYSAAMDLVDMYGFLAQCSLAEVEALKSWYKLGPGRRKKAAVEAKPVYFTRSIASAFESTVLSWEPAVREERFKDWLKEQAPCLDLPSRAAQVVYTNLAVYAYLRAQFEPALGGAEGIDFYNDMERIAKMDTYAPHVLKWMYTDSRPDPEKCAQIVAALVYENAEYAGNFIAHMRSSLNLYKEMFDVQKQDSKWFHIPMVKEKAGKKDEEGSTVVLRGGTDGIEKMLNILLQNTSPAKSDLLYLLWISANIFSSQSDPPSRAGFLDDFLASASCILEAALLPGFYPPNLLEEVILTSLAMGDPECPPAVVYESICRSIPEKVKCKGGKKGGMTAGKKKKTPEEQWEILAWYHTHLPEFGSVRECERACAAHFDISVKSVQNYKAKERAPARAAKRTG